MIGVLFVLTFITAAIVVGWKQWSRLEGREDAGFLAWFCWWVARGLGVPLAAYGVLDWLWFAPRKVAALPGVIAAPGGAVVPLPPPVALPGPGTASFRPGEWPGSTAEVLWLACAAWAAVNFVWLAVRAWRNPRRGQGSWITAVVAALLLLPVALLLVAGLGVPGTFWAIAFTGAVITSVLINSITAPVVSTDVTYGSATGLLKFGKFDEAEQAIIKQLEHAQDDYTGWLMLAELYALHFHDLPTADRTVHDLCAQRNVNRSQAAAALHKLADWYLAVDENPAAARSVVEEIEVLYPNTHLAFMARQRLRRLPASRAEYLASKQPSTIRLRRDAAAPGGFSPLTTRDGSRSEEQREELELRLADHPADWHARERLARLLEGPLRRPAEAIQHLRVLLARPEGSREQRSEWLGLLAAWQLRHQHDSTEGRRTLDHIVRDYAGTAAAEVAAERRQALAIEDRFRSSPARKPGPIRVEVGQPASPAPPPAEELPPPKWD